MNKQTNVRRYWLFSFVFLVAVLVAVFTMTAIASARTKKLTGANLALTNNIDILFWADIDEATARSSDTYVTFNDSASVTYEGMKSADGVSYAVYRYAGVLPQNMGDEIVARLYVNGALSDTLTYSVKEYCQSILQDSASATVLKSLVSDLLVYGAAAQAYLDEAEDTFVTNGVSGLAASEAPTKIALLSLPQKNDDLSREANASVKRAGLCLSNKVELYFDIDLPSDADLSAYTAKLMLSGRAEEVALIAVDGTYRACFSDILASELFEAGKVGVYKDGRRVSNTVSYSASHYLSAIFADARADTSLRDLTNALYNYALSVHKYVGAHTIQTPGTIRVTTAGTSSKDGSGTVNYACVLCGETAGTLMATHIRTYDTPNSNGGPANTVSGQSLFTLTTPKETNGNTYYSIIRDADENLGVGSLGYYLTKGQSHSAASYMDSASQYNTKAFTLSFDVRAPEAGILGASFNLQNTNTSGNGRFGNFLSINADGSITGCGASLAPTGTVNTDTWTNVTTVLEFTELYGESVIQLEYYVNGFFAASTYTPNTMYNGTFTQMHMAMSPKADTPDGVGLFFDNLVFAQGAVHIYNGTADEYLEQLEKKQLQEIMDMIEAGFDISDFSTVVTGYNATTQSVTTKTQTEFQSLNTTQYADPLAYPTEGQHPRLLFNESNIPGILAAMDEEDNQSAVTDFLRKATSSADGRLSPIIEVTTTGSGCYNYDATTLGIIEAKALYYALYKNSDDEITRATALMRGYQAIYAIKNYLLTLDIQWKASDQCRLYGHTMYSTALVYDWCYDLLTEADREQLMLGVQNLCCDGTSNYPSKSTHSGIKLEAGFPPQSHRQTPITGHGAEFQILRDYFAFAIAIYDENDTWYDNIGGLIYQDYIPVRDYFYTSGFYPDGSAGYNNYRFMADLWNAWLFVGMGVENPYNDEDMQTVIHGLISMETYGHNQFATGDGSNGVTIGNNVGNCALVSSYLFEDGVARAIAMEMHNSYAAFDYSQSGISAANYLILSSRGVKTVDDYQANVKDVAYHSGFQEQVIARSSKEADSAVVLMQGAQHLPGGHTHQNAGSFQIYYKGQLTRDDGLYDSYGFDHHYYYHMSTTAHNGLLIYNPSLASSLSGYYNGGQRRYLGIPYKYEDWLADENFSFGKNIGMQTDSVDDPTYVYFANDITNAYDAVTVDYVERSFMTVFTDDPTVPMILFVFDHVDADSKDFQKSFLLQCVTEPVVSTTDKTVKITNAGGGMLVLTSLLGADDIKAYGRTSKNGIVGGGDGSERFWLSGANKNLPPAGAEGGSLSDKNADNPQVWGHVEIRPATGSKENLLLNVLYVTDAGTTVSARPTLVTAAALTGASFMNRTAMFLSDPEKAASPLSFTAKGSGTMTYYVGGLNEGTWTVAIDGETVGTYDVTADGRMLTFEGKVGAVTLTPTFDVRPAGAGTIDYRLNGGTLPKDAPKYFNKGETATLPPPKQSGKVFDGWFADEALTQPINEIGADVTQDAYTVFAKWKDAILDVDYTAGGTLDDYNSLVSHNMGNSGTQTSYAVMTDDGAYLLWSSDGATPQIIKRGAFRSALADGEYAISFEITLAKHASSELQPTLLYIRDYEGTTSKDLHLMWLTADGTVQLGTSNSDVSIGTVDTTPTTIRLTIDFSSAMLSAYDASGRLLGSVALSSLVTPPSGYDSYAAWLDAFTETSNYMLALAAKGEGDLRIYGFRIAPGSIFAACRHEVTLSDIHSWDEGTVITAASTTSCKPGIRRYHCTVCGCEKDLQISSAIPHTFVYGNTAVTDGACEQSNQLFYTCTTCMTDILYANVVNVQTFENHCTCADLQGFSQAGADYSGDNLSLIGAFNTSNTHMTSNLDVRLLGGGSPSANSDLRDPKVAVIGFDVMMPNGGFSEANVNLNVKLNGVWGQATQLSFTGNSISLTSATGSYSKTMTAGVAVNVVVKMDLSSDTFIRYDYWINGDYCGYRSVTHSNGATNWVNVGSTYVNLTISRSDKNVDSNRGMILDNIFIADDVPVGFTQD